jgi:hypothetical protein
MRATGFSQSVLRRRKGKEIICHFQRIFYGEAL